MATVKDALNAIESHEKECKALYKSIDKRLEDGSKRFVEGFADEGTGTYKNGVKVK